jgi:hypothetical protein
MPEFATVIAGALLSGKGWRGDLRSLVRVDALPISFSVTSS